VTATHPICVQLRDARSARHLSVRALAARLDVVGGSLRGWEVGRRVPSLPTTDRWAAELGLSLALLPADCAPLLNPVAVLAVVDACRTLLESDRIGAGRP
jgi:transcriptional regulator with XRE-family HTH domain